MPVLTQAASAIEVLPRAHPSQHPQSAVLDLRVHADETKQHPALAPVERVSIR